MSYIHPTVANDIASIAVNTSIINRTSFQTRLAVRRATMHLTPSTGDIDRNIIQVPGQATLILNQALIEATV